MSKWTPGPWSHSHTSNIANMVVGPNNGCVATVQAEYASGATRAVLEAEAAANIRLIAEAPAMAEELAHLLALIEPALESGVTIPGLATMNRTRALLARLEEK